MSQQRYTAREGSELRVDPRNGWVHGSTSKFQPNVGKGIASSFAERTFRRLYRTDGSIAADEHRETLTLNHSDQGGWGIGDRRQLRASFSATGRAWMGFKHFCATLLGIAMVVGGTMLAWEISRELWNSYLLAYASVLCFWVYAAYLAIRGES